MTAGGAGGPRAEVLENKNRMVGETLSALSHFKLGSWTWQPGSLVGGGIPPPRLPQGHNQNQTKP